MRKIRIGDVWRCSGNDGQRRLLNSFAARGIDAKPTGEYHDVVIIGIDKPKRSKNGKKKRKS